MIDLPMAGAARRDVADRRAMDDDKRRFAYAPWLGQGCVKGSNVAHVSIREDLCERAHRRIHPRAALEIVQLLISNLGILTGKIWKIRGADAFRAMADRALVRHRGTPPARRRVELFEHARLHHHRRDLEVRLDRRYARRAPKHACRAADRLPDRARAEARLQQRQHDEANQGRNNKQGNRQQNAAPEPRVFRREHGSAAHFSTPT